MFHGMYSIVKNEGFKSLYKGALARGLYHSPYTAITMSFLETIRGKLIAVF